MALEATETKSIIEASRRLYPGVSRADDRGCGVRLVRGGRDTHRHAVLEGRRGELPPEGQTRRNRRRTLYSLTEIENDFNFSSVNVK